MSHFLDLPSRLVPIAGAVTAALDRVNERFDRQLQSEFPPVQRLCQHLEQYRGKMLRPMLVLASGLAAKAPEGGESFTEAQWQEAISADHITVAAVCEMIHMATLVHDDVLDEADIRRRGRTVNSLHGNEAAVILGDYLIAAAYHLCSQLDSQKVALMVGQVSMTLCTGELLQLSHREDLSLDEPTYFEIVERKTAALVGLACRLGGLHSGGSEDVCRRLHRFGMHIGVAFQIQDDLLDLTGERSTLGKPAGKDLEKGKLTLPMIHHLEAVGPSGRGRALMLLEEACGPSTGDEGAAGQLAQLLEGTGSIAHARAVAERLVAEARSELEGLAESPPRGLLMSMADAVVSRAF